MVALPTPPAVPATDYQAIAALQSRLVSQPPSFDTFETAGDSWTVAPATADLGWINKVRRLLGVEAARSIALGVNGATVINGPAFVDMTTAVLQSAHAHQAGNPTALGDWRNGSGLACISIGFNDYFQHPGLGAVGTKQGEGGPIVSAIRNMIARYRAARVFENDAAAGIAYGPNWANLATTTLNSGTGFHYNAVTGAVITHTVPADYDGRPIAIGYVSNGGSPIAADIIVRADGVQVLNYNTGLEEAQRVVFGTDRSYAGCFRLPNGVPIGTAQITITASIPAGNIWTFDHITYEGDPLVLLILKPSIPASYDPALTGNPAISFSNAWCRQAASEFPAGEVVVVDAGLHSGFGNTGAWKAAGDPHMSDGLGQAIMTEVVMQAVARANPTTLQRARA